METLYTVREVADRLRVDDMTVKRWIKNGMMQAIPLLTSGERQKYRIRQSAIDRMLEQPASTTEKAARY